MEKILQNDKFNIVITGIKPGYAHCLYTVELRKGSFPSDSELITMCDNGDLSGLERHFGGYVTGINKHKKIVKVYTD